MSERSCGLTSNTTLCINRNNNIITQGFSYCHDKGVQILKLSKILKLRLGLLLYFACIPLKWVITYYLLHCICNLHCISYLCTFVCAHCYTYIQYYVHRMTPTVHIYIQPLYVYIPQRKLQYVRCHVCAL